MNRFEAAWEEPDQVGSAPLESAMERLLESYRESEEQLFDAQLPEVLESAQARLGQFDRAIAVQQLMQLKEGVYKRLKIVPPGGRRDGGADLLSTAMISRKPLSQDANAVGEAERSQGATASPLRAGDELAKELHLAAVDYAEKRLDEAVARLMNLLRVQREPRMAAHIYHGLGVAFMELGNLATARGHLEKALLLIQQVAPDSDPPDILDDLGMVFFYHGDISASMCILYRGLMASLRRDDRESIARLSEHIGLAVWKSGYAAESSIWLTLSLAWRILQPSPGQVADSLDSLGRVCSSMELNHLALALHWRALEYRSDGKDQPAIAKTWTNLGTALRQAKQLRPALSCHQEAMRIRQRVRDRVGMANSHNNLGVVLLKMGRFRRARKQVRKALRIRRELGDRVNLARNVANLELIERHLQPPGQTGGDSP